jgi:hypothetical protein
LSESESEKYFTVFSTDEVADDNPSLTVVTEAVVVE